MRELPAESPVEAAMALPDAAIGEPWGRIPGEFPDAAEISALLTRVLTEACENGLPADVRPDLARRLETFAGRWRYVCERFGRGAEGELFFLDLLQDFEESLAPRLRSSLGAASLAATREALGCPRPNAALPPAIARQGLAAVRRHVRRSSIPCPAPDFDRPIFILSAPRSGSTLLFESLAALPGVWTVGGESHALIEGIPELHPAAHGYASNRLTAADATEAVVAALRARFAGALRDRTGRFLGELPRGDWPSSLRFLEKTPKNILRVPFLRAAFPGARFLVLYRRPEETLASLLEGWRSRRFEAYRPLPGWPHRAWKFLLVPGWEGLAYRPLAEVVACQWRMAYETLLADLSRLPASDWQVVRYADLTSKPWPTLRRVAGFAELAPDPGLEDRLESGLPWSSMTFSAPDPDKWRRHEAALTPVLPGLRELEARLDGLGQTHHAAAPGTVEGVRP